jgi:NTP pyrophosphatase (non-canonical NTP hydrolase)
MTLDEYGAWAMDVDVARYGRMPKGVALLELGLGFASEVGEIAGVLTKWLRDGKPLRDQLIDELGDAAYYWARLSVVAGITPSALLARRRAHVDWRRAGRAPGGPAPTVGGISIDEFTAWVLTVHGVASLDPFSDQSLWTVGLALVGDTGEVVECIRSLGREAGQHERLAGELGDVWRYWTHLCVATGISPAEVLTRSRTKIEERLTKRETSSPPPDRRD